MHHQKVPNKLPNLITSLRNAFSDNKNEFIDGIQYWDTSNISNMSWTFNNAIKFNQDLSSWNTSNVRDMKYMFNGAVSFNQDISKWNTHNVQTFEGMFKSTKNFNQDLSGWNISSLHPLGEYLFAKNSNLTYKNQPKWKDWCAPDLYKYND
ncbi:BspA family leucine-rich repeat surface protein [Mycoplasma capricolum]|uniref:BspA family leucine-rich repeat surface protein n=1 Tax=Mycoplasma capricolum TaxID=2095 RepID=UPI003DA33343